MAKTAVSLARYLLDETTGTLISDDEGSNDLTADFSTGDAVFITDTAGNGVDFTASPATAATAILELADISTNGNIGSSLDDEYGASCLFVIDLDGGHSNGSRCFHVGTDSGNGDFGVTFDAQEKLHVRWDYEDTGSNFHVYPAPSLTGLVVIAVIVDAEEAVEADRTKVYYDDVLQTRSTGDTIAVNSQLTNVDSTNRSMCIGNRPSQNRNVDGAIYYFELFTGQLTATEVSDATTALAADNDANWVAGGSILPAGIVSAEAFGTAVISTGLVTVSPSSIASLESFGAASITIGGVTLSPGAISSLEDFGNPTITTGVVQLQPSAIPSAEAFGTPVITVGAVMLQPGGIVSEETFGVAVLTGGAAPVILDGLTRDLTLDLTLSLTIDITGA